MNTYLLRCDRLSWGAFERPAYLLWEAHFGDFVPPETCVEDGDHEWILVNQGFDDGALAEQARQLGMPSFKGAFNLSKEETPAATTWEWRWNADSGPESSLAFRDAQPDETVGSRGPNRFFWFNETAVSYAQVSIEKEWDQLDFLSPTGTMSSPMMYANAGLPAYAGIGAILTKVTLSGSIHRFRDLECKEPIEP